MKFEYSRIKNAILLNERGIGFDEIISAIQDGKLMRVTDHHNPVKYPNQKIMEVMCLGKIYRVPYVEEPDGTFFLKTLYPSSKAIKKYITPWPLKGT